MSDLNELICKVVDSMEGLAKNQIRSANGAIKSAKQAIRLGKILEKQCVAIKHIESRITIIENAVLGTNETPGESKEEI